MLVLFVVVLLSLGLCIRDRAVGTYIGAVYCGLVVLEVVLPWLPTLFVLYLSALYIETYLRHNPGTWKTMQETIESISVLRSTRDALLKRVGYCSPRGSGTMFVLEKAARIIADIAIWTKFHEHASKIETVIYGNAPT